jgi:hypothetical protein
VIRWSGRDEEETKKRERESDVETQQAFGCDETRSRVLEDDVDENANDTFSPKPKLDQQQAKKSNRLLLHKESSGLEEAGRMKTSSSVSE